MNFANAALPRRRAAALSTLVSIVILTFEINRK